MKKKIFLSSLFGLLLVSCNLNFVTSQSSSSEDSSSSSSFTSSESLNTSSNSTNPNSNSNSGKASSSSSKSSSSSSKSSSTSISSSVSSYQGTGDYDSLSIHFLELGNGYAGDSIYIKAGDTDILIDAGSREGSAPTISTYINQYCTDGKLEYVIATHAHQDHIAGFVGTNSIKGIFDLYKTGIIIDYAYKNTTSAISRNYEAKRDAEIEEGAIHYTAKECMEKSNGANSTYTLAKGITLNILDQDFYYKKSSDENNHSVCCLISQGDNHFLLTGDLEKEGEESLVRRNPNLPHVRVFKGGHHGSKTSSNETLLSEITPEVVCVCCCAGTDEYTKNRENQFPTQDFINRVAKYTNRIYVTSQATSWTVGINDGELYPVTSETTSKSMNGNIVVTSNGQGFSVHGSNNDTKLKDTEWFNTILTSNGKSTQMRYWPEDGVVTQS